ncbi:hypothetical protein D3C86_1576900 [compost metagenome]
MLTDLPFESNVGFDNKFSTEGLQALGQCFPLRPFQNDAEVGNRYVVAVNRIAVNAFLRSGLWMLVDDQLMTIKIKIDPLIAGAPLGESKHFAVERTRSGQVVNRNCQVERRKTHRDSECSFYRFMKSDSTLTVRQLL